ncbi:MAG: hypothetical protein ACT4O5_12380 [Gammaproteobacteria bacterium]
MPARWFLVAFFACALADALLAADVSPACAGPEYGQFDFWVGDWEVYAGGTLAGTNSITREHGGCVLVEHWVGVRGMTGTSLNVYLPSKKKWHQTWADSTGKLLQLFGEFREGAMHLTGAGINGGATLDKTTWTPNADGTVRQLWEQSQDGGKSWAVVFDGLYRRKARETSPAAAARD